MLAPVCNKYAEKTYRGRRGKKGKVPSRSIEALWVRGGIAPTLS
jgi:hypothetical protein